MTAGVQQGLAPTRTVLDNGVVVLAKESRVSPAVTISASFRAGNFYDPPDRVGLANFVARTIDRGTERRDADQIAEELDGRGVTLSISTARLTFTLTCTCLVEDVASIVELVGDVAIRPTFPGPEVETRRGEILTSLRQDEDNPAVRAVEGLFSLLYRDGHPYGRPAKGTVQTVSGVGREALSDFHRGRFAPSGLSIAIVGDLEPRRAVDLVARVFGEWQRDAPADGQPSEVEPCSSRASLVVPMMNKAQTDIAYGFTTITRRDPRYYAFSLVNNVLGQYGLGGRLGDSIRERQGMAYYVFSSFDANVIRGPLIIRAGVAPANVDRAIASIDEEVFRAAREGLTSKELEEAKLFLVGSLPRALETNGGIATFLQTAEYFGLGLDHDLRLPALVSRVTLDEANELARDFLVPDRAAVVVAGPYTPHG